MMGRVTAVLFDLDGTLVDSAPDLAGTANDMRAERGLDLLPWLLLRPHAGSGARGMVGAAFDLRPGDTGYETLRDDFHRRYGLRMLRESTAFTGVAAMLLALEAAGTPWGIVTNKALRFAEPMADALGVRPRSGVLVGGDSTPYTKPHPEPLLEAARRLGQPPQAMVYVGDDLRDIRAGRAAGMQVVAAAWGYLGPGPPVHEWGADAVITEPNEFLKWLQMT
jgi:phosphoglycolate phosphatase